MTSWVCQWKPFWIPVDDSYKKAYVEDWVFQVADSSDFVLSKDQGDLLPETPRVDLPVPSSHIETPRFEASASTQERYEAPLPSLSSRPTCERLELPFSDDEILSGLDDHRLPRSDLFTTWSTMTPEEILAEHVVDIRRTVADFRDAYDISQTSSTRASGVNKFFTSQSPLQRRLSVYNWNPGPRRGKEDAIEKQIAGRWHPTTLQEAFDYVNHAILHERFYVTHFAGCAVLFNKDTFYANIDVKSIYLHDTTRPLEDHIVKGEHGWVVQGVVSRASFRRAASSG